MSFDTTDAAVELTDPLLDQIRKEWDKAEGNIKQAEDIQGELCLPAVNELRYAGRRLVDALAALQSNNREDAKAKFYEAQFDCYRARHDSIDVISSKIAKDIEITLGTFGIEVVVNAFKDYSDLISLSFTIQEKIEKSRLKRKDRQAIYETIENCDIEALIAMYRRFRSCEPVMVQLADAQVEDKFYEKASFWLGVLAFVLAAIAIAQAYFYWAHPR